MRANTQTGTSTDTVPSVCLCASWCVYFLSSNVDLLLTLAIPGITSWTNGSRHEGIWQNGREHGKGCYTTAGMCYIGNFTEGVIDGHGIHCWDDGSSFEGSYMMLHACYS